MSDFTDADHERMAKWCERPDGTTPHNAICRLFDSHSTLRARVAELEAERETFIKHLTAIERVSNDSRSQSRRMQYITARARSAINGDKEWIGIPRPRKGTKEGTIEHLQDANSSLRRENERLTAERDRLWAWHDEAVSRVSCHLCAVNLPQPLKRDK